MWRFTISPELDCGETVGSTIDIMSKFSSLCRVATVSLGNY